MKCKGNKLITKLDFIQKIRIVLASKSTHFI